MNHSVVVDLLAIVVRPSLSPHSLHGRCLTAPSPAGQRHLHFPSGVLVGRARLRYTRTHLPPVRVLRRAVLPERLLGSVYQDHFTYVTVRSRGKGERSRAPRWCAQAECHALPVRTHAGVAASTALTRCLALTARVHRVVVVCVCMHTWCTCSASLHCTTTCTLHVYTPLVHVCTAVDTATLRCYVVLTQQQRVHAQLLLTTTRRRSVMQYTLLRCLHTLHVYVYTVCTCTTTACTRCCIAYACTACALLTHAHAVLQLLLLLVVVSCIGSLTRRVGSSGGGGSPRRPKAFARHTPRYCAAVRKAPRACARTRYTRGALRPCGVHTTCMRCNARHYVPLCYAQAACLRMQTHAVHVYVHVVH